MNEYVLPVIALACSISALKVSLQSRLYAIPEFKAGWDDHLKGKLISKNPYAAGTQSFKAWKLGWKRYKWRNS